MNQEELQSITNSLLGLLEDKNSYLTCFIELNDEELHRFSDGRFEHVEVFYQNRERVLDIIKCLDVMIAEKVEQLSGQSLATELCESVQKLMGEKDRLAKQIMIQDEAVLNAIEVERNRVLAEYNETQFSKKVVGAYGLPERRQKNHQQIDDEV